MNPIILVTGATSGFGKSIAWLYANRGYDVIITGRRKNRLESLQKEIENLGVRCHSLSFDIRFRDEVYQAVESLPEEWKSIQVLVNNAGLALGKEPIAIAKEEDWEQMLDTNVKGLLYMSKAVSKFLTSGSTVINIGSIAGKEVYPGGNVYCASKHAVDAITKALRMELAAKGIRVSQIAPGAAETEFSLVRFKGDGQKADAVYQGFDALQAEDIAETAWFITSRPKHVCLNDVIIMPTAQPNTNQLFRNS